MYKYNKNIINAAVNAELMPNNLLHMVTLNILYACVRMYV